MGMKCTSAQPSPPFRFLHHASSVHPSISSMIPLMAPERNEIIYICMKVIHSFLCLILISAFYGVLCRIIMTVNQSGTRKSLVQLLLLALPLLLTLQALVELPPFTDRSHQWARLPPSPAPLMRLLKLFANAGY